LESSFAVFFRSGACDLSTAAKSLEETGLTVTRRDGRLIAGRPGCPQFEISVSSEPHVAVEAAEIGAGTPHAAEMRKCGARFEVYVEDLELALDETNTMMEVQGALQEASQGYLFLSWNGELLEPWKE
jgi:hypothetical protein